MSVDTINSNSSAIYGYSSTQKTDSNSKTNSTSKETKTNSKQSTSNKVNDTGVVYTKSTEDTKNTDNSKKIYKPDFNIANKMKFDAEQRSSQLRSLVEKMMNKQGVAILNSNSMYEALRKGQLNVDPDVVRQAQKDISEDGYWGVNKTSDRIFSFATALSGGDPDKMDTMLEAFKKGFDSATKAWGGKLPSICQDTYDAVIKKFEDYKNQNTTTNNSTPSDTEK